MAWPLRSSLVLLLAGLAGCRGGDAPAVPKLTLGAYTTPREAYGAIVPAFRAEVRARTGRDVEVSESYLGSGAQARAIAGGFEADVAALSLWPDLETIRAAGLLTRDPAATPHGGIVTRSIVVLGVRAGNPKQVHDFTDLTRPGLEVLTPNVRTSGGAMWNVLAIYGAALRGHAGGTPGDRAAAERLLAAVLANTKIMDRSARDSMLSFERGVGDVIVTYENEILVGRKGGQTYEYVVPKSTILIENPVAVVDVYADRHQVRDLADAFVRFLFTPDAQRIFAEHGLRPVVDSVAAGLPADRFPPVGDLFSVRDLGGWEVVVRDVFGEGGAYDRALAAKDAGRP